MQVATKLTVQIPLQSYSFGRTLCPYLAYLASTGYGSNKDNLVVRRHCFLVLQIRSIDALRALYIYIRSIPTGITHDLALLENGVESSGDSVVTSSVARKME